MVGGFLLGLEFGVVVMGRLGAGDVVAIVVVVDVVLAGRIATMLGHNKRSLNCIRAETSSLLKSMAVRSPARIGAVKRGHRATQAIWKAGSVCAAGRARLS